MSDESIEFQLRKMEEEDWPEVAALIYTSTNAWYETHGRPAIFNCPIGDLEWFCSVYETLDPGCCMLAEDILADKWVTGFFPK